jgi:hypothetical protein
VVTPDLPTADDSAGLSEYADTVVDAIGDRRDLVLVAQSLAGFIAPLVCARVPVTLMVLVTAMVPWPGESPRDWFANTGWVRARREHAEREGREISDDVDVMTEFFHDVPAEVVTETFSRPEPVQSDTPFGQPWPLDAWPDVPTKFVLCRADRFFPPTSWGALSATASASHRTRSQVATCPRSASRRSWRVVWRVTARR